MYFTFHRIDDFVYLRSQEHHVPEIEMAPCNLDVFMRNRNHAAILLSVEA
jgi:hypothetical protein